MEEAIKRRIVAILHVLREAGRPLGASRLAHELETMGLDLSQRTVRNCLALMDRMGLTRSCGKRGRQITPLGERELENSFVAEKVGFISAKVDELAYEMTFKLRARRGTVILNISSVPLARAGEAVAEMMAVFRAGLGMGRLAVVAGPGERIGNFRVPDGRLAVGTVCSVTINGILLSAGIPTTARFGGLLELRDGEPLRFTQMIYYEGTSLDPLEIFISGGMTSVREAARSGSGLIGAGFREIPGVAVPRVQKICKRLEEIDLGGLLMVGKPNRPLLEVPVPDGRAGLVVVGGLNPLAAVQEAGIPTDNKALSTLFEFDQLVPFESIAEEFATPQAEP